MSKFFSDEDRALVASWRPDLDRQWAEYALMFLDCPNPGESDRLFEALGPAVDSGSLSALHPRDIPFVAALARLALMSIACHAAEVEMESDR